MNTMDERLTITQVLEITVELLEGIDVPMKYIDSIGIPTAKAINNLKLCIDAQKQAEEKAKQEEKPDLKVVSADDAEEVMGDIDFGEVSEDERNADAE